MADDRRIGRRTAFIAGACAALSSAPAFADVLANGQLVADPNEAAKKKKDVPYTPIDLIPNHRQLMRDIVVALSAYAKQRNPHFIMLARNGPELVSKGPREWNWETIRDPDGYAANKYAPIGTVNYPYLRAIDGMLVDGLFFGRTVYDMPTRPDDAKPLLAAMAVLDHEHRRTLTIEYCKGPPKVLDAEKMAAARHTLTYVDEEGDKTLTRVPAARPQTENPLGVSRLDDAKNFLPVLDGSAFPSRTDWVNAMVATNDDMLIVDVFFRGAESLLRPDVDLLKHKRMGTDRLVLARLPLARAREDRFYWKTEWKVGNPAFLDDRDPDNQADIMVRYWDKDWKAILGRYMQGIVDLGFDGVLLDDVDAYLYFEDLFPIQ
jgi:hypothetical protein